MKTIELTGAALDWAVAKCMTGGELFQSGRIARAVVLHSVGRTVAPYFVKDSGMMCCAFEPSTDWAQGGPIIERERFRIVPNMSGGFTVSKKIVEILDDDGFNTRWVHGTGPTILIAAMRCHVASRLGDDVAIPADLLG